MKLLVPRDLSEGCLMQDVAFILASLPVMVLDSKPAHASCWNNQGNYGCSYYICSFVNSVMLRGCNSRTGSNWTETAMEFELRSHHAPGMMLWAIFSRAHIHNI